MHREEIIQDFSWSLINTIFELQKCKRGRKTCMHVRGMISMEHMIGV